jgi:hypothetical protein
MLTLSAKSTSRVIRRILPPSRGRVPMRYKVGAEQLQQVPSLVHRPDTVFRVARTAAVGPTHAVRDATGAAACGIKADQLQVLDQDWEAACFVEKCPGCFAVVISSSPPTGR